MGEAKYHNFMENSLGLGRNGTHLVHAGIAGGATWALGEYGGVTVISDNWWAPFAGAFAGLGLSVVARSLMVNDEAKVGLALSTFEREIKNKKLTKDQQKTAYELFVKLELELEDRQNERKLKARHHLEFLDEGEEEEEEEKKAPPRSRPRKAKAKA